MANKTDKNAWRRIAYNYYRSQGYTPAQARNLRGRKEKVISDYRGASVSAKRHSKPPPKPPNLMQLQSKARQREQYQIAKQVLGLSPKAAERFRRLDGYTFAERIANITKAGHRLNVAGAMKKDAFNDFIQQALDVGWREYYRLLKAVYDKAIAV